MLDLYHKSFVDLAARTGSQPRFTAKMYMATMDSQKLGVPCPTSARDRPR